MKKIWLFAIVADLGLGIAFGVDSLNVVHANDIPVIVRNKFAYTVTIPSELDINTLGNSGSFEISGELHKRYWMNLNISSANSFKMKSSDKSSSTLNYSLSKTQFSYTPQYPVDNNNYDFSETINYDVDEDSILYSGEYRDNLVFNFEPLETRTVVLDCNGGDSNGLDIIQYTVRDGSTYGDLPTPVREGYTFVGWKDAKNNTIYSKSIVEPDTERLTALWYRECTTGIGSYMNGALADRLRHIGTSDVYVNGELQTKNSESPIARGNEGDTFCFTNFKLENNIILKGIKSNPENYDVEYDSNGNVSKISGKLKSNASDIVLDFEYGNLLQHIIDINNADALIFDNTAPTCETVPVLNNEFDSKVVYYMKGNELHLANPDGGKVSTTSDVKGLFSYLNVRYLDIQNLDISKTQSLKEFFYKSTCETINVTGLDTSNIGNFHACFGNASKLANIIGLETWDVSKGTNFYEFFNYCSRLQNADAVANWNLSSATDMGRFFQGVKFPSGTIQLNWSHTFTDLDKYKNGTEIQYTIREKSVDGYTAVYKNEGNKWAITNKYTPEKISLTINKKWDDAENQDGIRPDSVKAVLYANSKKVQDIELNENNHWSVSVLDLYKNENGKPIQYEVKEITETKGYTSSVSSKGNTWTITNTHKPSKISVSGTKTWKDDSNRDGIRPDSVTVRLFAEGKEIAHKKVNAQSNWKYEFTDLDEFKAGQKIAYSITEDAVEGYSTTYNKFNLVNTHDINKLSVSVRKVWNDNNNQDGIRPESVTIRLYQNDVATDKTLTLSEENGWQGSFADLFKNENGTAVNYSVKEDNVPEGYECDIKKDDNGVFVITNSHTPAVMSIPVSKVWDDDNNRDGVRSSDIDVTLYKNGTLYDSKTITADSNWNTVFENVPVNEGGQPINWTVDEMDIPSGYTADVQKAGNGFVITNSYEPEKISLKVSKEWDDKDDEDGIRPESVTIRLMANGTEIGEYQITKENDWKLEIKDLFRYDNGSEIKYTITEDEVKGYKSEIQDYRNSSDVDEKDDEDAPTPYAQFIPDKDAEYEFDFVVKNTHEVKPKAVKPQSPAPPAQVTVSSDEIKTGIHLDYSVWMILGCFCLGCLAGIGLHKIRQKKTRG